MGSDEGTFWRNVHDYEFLLHEFFLGVAEHEILSQILLLPLEGRNNHSNEEIHDEKASSHGYKYETEAVQLMPVFFESRDDLRPP